jgi:hypothetical protein
MLTKRVSRTLILGAVVSCCALGSTNTALGVLNIDIRATSVSGGGTLVNPKLVALPVPGTVIRFDIFAVVVGTNGSTADDRFISVSGSWRSSNGGLRGNIETDLVRTVTDPDTGEIVTAGFDGAGSSVGLQQDLDGDGDLDVGSNVDDNPNHFWAASFSLAPQGVAAGSTNPLTGGRKIGFGTFTVFDTGMSFLNFDGRNALTAATYIQDGQLIHEPSIDGLVPVQTNVPEPASLGVAALSALSFRRSRARHDRAGRRRR